MTTPNMGLLLPAPGTTVGPTWASELNDAFEIVDAHDHSSSSGVRITPAGLSINANLPFGDFSLTGVGSLDLTDLVSNITTGSARLYVYGGELYYRDTNANAVRITASGIVNGAGSGNISGLTPYNDGQARTPNAAFSSSTYAFAWTKDTNLLAKMYSSDLSLYEFDAVSPNPITIKSPASVAAAYSITLPEAHPSATYPLTMSSTGVLDADGTIGVALGSAAAPPIAFAADLDSGFYQAAASPNTIGLSLGGTVRWSATTTAATTSLLNRAPDGSVSAPAYSFAGSTNSGMYSVNTTDLQFAVNGVQRLGIESTNVECTAQLRVSVGSAGTPSVAFSGDTDTGVFSPSSGEVAIACEGTQRLKVTTDGISFDANTTSFKMKLITVGTTSSASGNIAAAHGLTLSKIRGLLGSKASSTAVTGPNYFTDIAAVNTNSFFECTADSTNINITFQGQGSASKTFYATIIYVE